ncbi:membrane protein [Staphylococcus hominis]|nr:membrane protein [Staphylococcus hominis]
MLYKSIFRNLILKKSVWLFLAIALYPLLILIMSLLPTNFMQLGGEKNGLYGLDFFNATLGTQYQFVLPLILMTYFISTMFYEEFASGRLIFFKDINRTKLLNNKLMALITIYTIYFIILFIATELLFFTYLTHFDYAANSFLPQANDVIKEDVLSIVSTILITYISVFFGIMLSMKLSTGFTILGVIFSFIIITISPMVRGLNFFFPNGYIYNNQSLWLNLLIMIVLTIVYCLIFYIISVRTFKKLEY